MEVNSARPAATEVVSTTAAAAEQAGRFNERKSREAQSDVKNDAVFFSPVVKIDKETHSTVIQYRDSNTGEVTRQYPDKAIIGAYEQAQETAPPAKEVAVETKDAPVVASEEKPVEVKKAPEPEVKEPVVDEKA